MDDRPNYQMEMSTDQIQTQLRNWFMRQTVKSGARRVRDLGIALTSDIGTMRSENQDRLAVLRIRTQEQSFLVAALSDGMGGMVGGGLAASITLSSFLCAFIRNRHSSVHERLLSAAGIANEAVYSEFRGKGGSTLSAFVVDSNGAVGGVNVGDSRIYALTQNSIDQLSQDDTIAGQIGAKDNASNIRGRNDLLQYIGVGKDIEPHFVDLSSTSDQATIMLTSDGIHFLDPQILRSIVRNAESLATAARRLSELSKWCGGTDNASVLIASSIRALAPNSQTDSLGVIEVWDAFNEIQIINAGIHRENRESSVSVQPTDSQHKIPAAAESNEGASEDSGNKKRRQAKKAKHASKTKAKRKKKLQQPDDADIPQLKIDFEKGEDASRG